MSTFLQELRDWGDIGADLEPSDRVKESFRLTETLRDLSRAGFAVLGGVDVRVLEGGAGKPMPFPIVVMKVVRVNGPSGPATDPEVIFGT